MRAKPLKLILSSGLSILTNAKSVYSIDIKIKLCLLTGKMPDTVFYYRENTYSLKTALQLVERAKNKSLGKLQTLSQT